MWAMVLWASNSEGARATPQHKEASRVSRNGLGRGPYIFMVGGLQASAS